MGFNWSVSRVVELEAGKVAPTIGVVAGLLSLLREASERALEIGDLLPEDGRTIIEIAPGVATTSGGLRDFLAGTSGALITGTKSEWHGAVSLQASADEARRYRSDEWSEKRLAFALLTYGVADERVARELKLPLGHLLNIAASLWGRSVTEERNRRAPSGANPQALGQITRALTREIRASGLLDEASGR
jgi:hypothetical protein